MQLQLLPVNNDHALINLSISQQQTKKGTFGYYSIVILTGIISPIFGAAAATVQAINGIWNSTRLSSFMNEKLVMKEKLRLVKEKVALLIAPQLQQNGMNVVHDAQIQVEELTLKINKLREDITELKNSIEENKKKFIAAILTTVPFIGIFAAGFYLKSLSSEVKEKGIRGSVEAITEAIVGGQEKFLQGFIYPLRGKELGVWKKSLGYYWLNYQTKILNRLGAQPIKIPVNRGNKEGSLDAFLILNNHGELEPEWPTIVLFHGNGQTIYTMANHAQFYHQLGFNVLMVTMGGYPGSDEGVETSEISSYQDANAAINYLKDKGVKNIGVHGTSIGGTLAFASAELHPDVVKIVIADQTLGRARDVAANLIDNISSRMLPTAIIRGVIGGAFAFGKVVRGVIGPNGKPYLTDGLNNIRKAAVLREREARGESNCEVFVIKSRDDIIMGRNGNPLEGFKENFGDDIALTRYGNLDGHITEIPGGHCGWFDHHDDEIARPLIEKLNNLFLHN